MTDHDAQSSDDRIDDLFRALPSTSAPAGFADRVLAHHARRARIRRTLVLAAGACAVIVVAVVAALSASRTSGEAIATGRETVAIGRHAVAVLEPSAVVHFDVDGPPWSERAIVAHDGGRAFYRVDKGSQFRAITPAGEVVVHGTCFTLDLQQDPSMSPIASSLSSPWKNRVLGAAVGAVLSVVVLEGSVRVANDHGSADVVAGQRAVMPADGPPVVTTPHAVDDALVRRLRAENEDLQAALDNAQAAAGGDVQKLIAENKALRDKLRHDDEELALNDADRADKEGKPRAFPQNLPARFTQDQLLKSFTNAFKEAGIDGDVTHIDCDEFPCIVYGEVKTDPGLKNLDASKIMEQLNATPSYSQYKDDADNNSWWRSLKKTDDGKTEADTQFGIALWPKSDNGDGNSDDIAKRIGFRNQTMWNAMKPASK